MLSSLAGPMRLASVVICLIVITSFGLFVVNRTSSASAHQQEEAAGRTPTTPAPAAHAQTGSARRTIDDVSEAITSPFSAVTAGSSSQWVIRGVNVVLALLVYGFGLAFLARIIRVRV